jgi:excisionase family DNA binding protein
MKSRNRPSRSLMTTSELAEYLKVSQSTIYKLLRNGSVPFLRLGSGFYFERREINKWIADRQLKSAGIPNLELFRKRRDPSRRDE